MPRNLIILIILINLFNENWPEAGRPRTEAGRLTTKPRDGRRRPGPEAGGRWAPAARAACPAA